MSRMIPIGNHGYLCQALTGLKVVPVTADDHRYPKEPGSAIVDPMTNSIYVREEEKDAILEKLRRIGANDERYHEPTSDFE